MIQHVNGLNLFEVKKKMNLIVKPINLVFQTHNANSKDLNANK